MKKIIHCYDKMNSNSGTFSQLMSYYQQLVQSNPTDTDFVNIAEDLAAKCLVRMGEPTDAITEYEHIIANTSDTLEILSSKLNIIETYMIIQQGGDAPNFTGKLTYLKPSSVKDGFRKIMEKLRKSTKNKLHILPDKFSLSQNYPNPFNPITKINYAIPKKSNVTLKVYDVLGRLVKTLVNELKEAGYYIVQFDGSALASGVYFYKIEAGDFVQSKKMVVVK